MKQFIFAAAAAMILFSCKKEQMPAVTTDNSYLHTVLTQLKDSLSTSDFQNLDTGAVYLTSPGKTVNYSLRIGLRGKRISQDFLLVRTDETGKIGAGAIVHMDNTTSAYSYQFSGSINIRSFSGKLSVQSQIANGRILGLHAGKRSVISSSGTKTVTLLPAPDADWLPEVIVVGYSGSAAPTPYISLDALLGGVGNGDLGINSGGGQGDPGSPSGGSSSGGNSGDGNTGSATPPASPAPSAPYSPLDPTNGPIRHSFGASVTDPIDVEQEYIFNLPAINISSYLNCFDQVPSDGASYTIQLCADVPSNGNPDASMTFSGGIFAGHTFLVVTKSGGGMSISQSFGFYPSGSLSAWNPFTPISSVIRDNGNSEINASLTMTINPDQFNVIKNSIVNLSKNPYQLDKSNCSDYAIGVFNSVRAAPLLVEPYLLRQAGVVMGNGLSSPPITVPIANSPQMIYQKLSAMKANGDTEASNIQLDLSHNLHSPNSHGPCN
jgi:hypothetical protein